MAMKGYDVTKFDRPSVTVDIVVFTIRKSELQALLIKRGEEPFKGMYAIPGGFVRPKETLKDAAKRELKDETGVTEVYLEQLYTFGGIERDPRTRVITVAYYALVNSEKLKLKATTDAVEAKWFPIKKLPKLAFDHEKILNYALKRLRYKLEYTAVGFELLPKKFTLQELQKVYEIILGQKLDKRNFRKKIARMDTVEPTKEMKKGAHRPARLYRFKRTKPKMFFSKIKFEG